MAVSNNKHSRNGSKTSPVRAKEENLAKKVGDAVAIKTKNRKTRGTKFFCRSAWHDSVDANDGRRKRQDRFSRDVKPNQNPMDIDEKCMELRHDISDSMTARRDCLGTSA